ncbi:MAG: hypothetical protein K2W99_05510 [Chthoniobacterales bacterium]|nr:hypothetical protein [Chthoniobacterales bacterium]
MKKFFLVLTSLFLLVSVRQSTASEAAYYVSNQKYCEFLKSVALEDPHSLYTPALRNNGIFRWGKPGFYEYNVVDGKEDNPVTSISWACAARCANWLEWLQQHQEATVMDDPDTMTESGVYTLDAENQCVEINASATYLLPRNTNEVSFANFPEIGTWGAPDCEHPEVASILRDGMPMERIDAALDLSTIGIRFKAAVYQGILPPINIHEWRAKDYGMAAGGFVAALFVGGHLASKAHECWIDRRESQGRELTEEELREMQRILPGENDPLEVERQKKQKEDEESARRQELENMKGKLFADDDPASVSVTTQELKEIEKVTEAAIESSKKEIAFSEKEKKELQEREAKIRQRFEELSKNENPSERDYVAAEKVRLEEELRTIKREKERLKFNKLSEESELERLEEEKKKLKELDSKEEEVEVDENIERLISSNRAASELEKPQEKFGEHEKSESKIEITDKSPLSREAQYSLERLLIRNQNRRKKVAQQIFQYSNELIEVKKQIKHAKGVVEDKATSLDLGAAKKIYQDLQKTLENLNKNKDQLHGFYKSLITEHQELLQLRANHSYLNPETIDKKIKSINENFEQVRGVFRNMETKITDLGFQAQESIRDLMNQKRNVESFENLKKREHQQAIQNMNQKEENLQKAWMPFFKHKKLKTAQNKAHSLGDEVAQIEKKEQNRLRIDHTFDDTPEIIGLTPAKKGISKVIHTARNNLFDSHRWLKGKHLPLTEENYRATCSFVDSMNVDLNDIPKTAFLHPKRLFEKIETAHTKVVEALESLNSTEEQAFRLADAIGTNSYTEKLEKLQRTDTELSEKIEERTKEITQELREAQDISNYHLPKLKKTVEEYVELDEADNEAKKQKLDYFKELLQSGTEMP